MPAFADAVRYDYDGLGRLCRTNYADGSTINYGYDASGNRAAVDHVTGPGGVTTSGDCPASPFVFALPPDAVDDFYTQTHSTTVLQNVLSNDTDPNGDTLTVTAEDSPYATISSNMLSFVAPSASGAYPVNYTISDGNGGTDTAVMTVTVPNVAPNAVNDVYSQTHSTTVLQNVLSNDTDANGDSLTITAEDSPYATISSNKLSFIAPAASGTYAVNYTISDGKGATDTAAMTITVANVAPNAVNDGYIQTHSTTVLRNVLSNDTDANGDGLTITSENSPHATISANKLSFAAPAASGSYPVSYTISDGKGGTDTAVMTVTVPNVAPNAVNNAYTQQPGTTVNHNVLGNDTDANGDALTITSENHANSSIVSNKLRFVAPLPPATYVITYGISDGHGGTDTATATITVPNVAPNAVNDTYTQTHGTTVSRNVVSNDTDANGDSLTITSENSPHATIVSNQIRFVAPNASGAYSVTYTVSDGRGGTDSAVATVNVPNVAPTTTFDNYTVTGGTTNFFNVLANDSDPNGDTLTLTYTTDGTIQSNQIRYVAPNVAFAEFVNMSYTVSDGKGGSTTQSVMLTVMPSGGGGFPPF